MATVLLCPGDVAQPLHVGREPRGHLCAPMGAAIPSPRFIHPERRSWKTSVRKRFGKKSRLRGGEQNVPAAQCSHCTTKQIVSVWFICSPLRNHSWSCSPRSHSPVAALEGSNESSRMTAFPFPAPLQDEGEAVIQASSGKCLHICSAFPEPLPLPCLQQRTHL